MEDFTDSTSSKRYGRLEKCSLDLSMVKKTTTESKTKGKKLDPLATCVVNNS